MGQINVTWVKDFTFIGTDSTNHSVVISSPKDGVGVKPSELLMVSLGACTSYDVVNILTKKRAKITGLQVAVSGEQDEDPPWTFRKLHIHYQISGVNLKPEDVEKAIQLSEEKYCSVSATLRQAAEITYDVEIIEA